MSYKFFLIPVRDPGDAESELNAFLGNHRVVAVDRRWVDQGADSYWAFCIDYYVGAVGSQDRQRGAKGRGKDYREILSPDDFALFAQLRELRKEVAQAEAVPVYTIFTNEQLAQMVQGKARNRADLERIAGVGDARIEKYGPRFLEVLRRDTDKPDATSGESV
jgi:superfamily II DNA helicase RecQ